MAPVVKYCGNEPVKKRKISPEEMVELSGLVKLPVVELNGADSTNKVASSV